MTSTASAVPVANGLLPRAQARSAKRGVFAPKPIAMVLLAMMAGLGILTGRAFAAPDAADAAPAGAPVKAAVCSVSSLNRLADVAKSIGVDELPPFLTPKGIGEQFKFIGPDGIDPDRPIGILYFAAADLNVTQGQGVVFVLPVKPAAATIESLTKLGAAPRPDRPDVADLGKITFRRTENYLLFGLTPETVLGVEESDLTDAYKPGAGAREAVARVTVNVEAIRKAAPDKFEAFLQQTQQSSAAKDDAEKFGQDLTLNYFRAMNGLDLFVGLAGDNFEIKCALAPAKMPAGGTFPRSGMPVDVAIRIDAGVSIVKYLPSLDKMFGTMLKLSESQGNAALTPEQKEQTGALAHKALEVLMGGKAVSVGVAPNGKQTVVYVVQQHDAAVNVGDQMRELADQFNKAAETLDDKSKGEKSSADVQEYEDGGLAVTRLRMLNHDKPQAYIDAVAKGTNVYMTGAADNGSHVAALAALPPRGTTTGVLNGAVDLEKLERSFAPQIESMRLTPAQRKALDDTVKGRRLDFTADGDGDSIVVRLAVPRGLVKDVVHFALPKRNPRPVEGDQPNGGGL